MTKCKTTTKKAPKLQWQVLVQWRKGGRQCENFISKGHKPQKACLSPSIVALTFRSKKSPEFASEEFLLWGPDDSESSLPPLDLAPESKYTFRRNTRERPKASHYLMSSHHMATWVNSVRVWRLMKMPQRGHIASWWLSLFLATTPTPSISPVLALHLSSHDKL